LPVFCLIYRQDLVESQKEKLFVGVDEYDAPANTILFESDRAHYRWLAGLFNASFFAIMKNAAYTIVERYWTTGVLPVFRDGFSSLDGIQIISNKPGYNGVFDFTETEVQEITRSYLSSHEPR
jgi:hypothetical protein